MAILFSPSALAFFSTDVNAQIPDDAVEITAERHRELLDAQANGATICADSAGKPRATRPNVDLRRAAVLRRVKREAARRIERIAPVWRQLNDQRAPTDDSQARFAAIDAVRAASDAIEADVATMAAAALDALDVPSHSLWPAE